MAIGDKYKKLREYLEDHNTETHIILSYEQIESIIGKKLPESAYKYSEAWWANTNSPQATAWIGTGYETDYVTDTYKKESVVFVKRP